MREPRPWLSHTTPGRAICHDDVTPPASDRLARERSSADRGWRSRKIRSCSAMSSSSLLVSTEDARTAMALPDQRVRTALGQLVGDDDPLDLGGPLPDPVDAELAEEPLGDVLAHVPAAA